MKSIEYRGGVVSFRIPSHWKEEYEENGGGAFYEDGAEIVRLPSGDGMKRYRKDANEAGESLHIYHWDIAHCAPPQKYCLAVFTWTILATQSGDEKFQDEIQMVTRELEQVRFHPDLGSL